MEEEFNWVELLNNAFELEGILEDKKKEDYTNE